jgi:ketosteroid isomerase-like protein
MAQRETIDSNDTKQIVVAAWKAFATRDPKQVAAVFSADAEWLAPAQNATATALGGTSHLIGRDRIVHFLTNEFGTVFVGDVSIEFHGIFAAGETVIVEEHMRARLPNGGEYDNDYCFVFELQDGLIRRVREYMDTRRAAEWFARDIEGSRDEAQRDDGRPHPTPVA